ncbi:MAG: hypothetical protein L6R42_005972 [Xanthoria sp. 1 TBL-2021]|nr:MAG: hypothetical protein L6R42_005972 [Xanthoria sp. 1 TBL-2021]
MTIEKLVAEAQKGKTKLDERRKNRQPLAKFGNTLQSFTSTWYQFTQVYAGMNDVAKGIDSQYGGLASGALMVLLQVGENKEAREKAITSIFEELTESWIGDAGRLKLYSNAYPDSTRLEGFVANVYLGVAELAIESVEYYSMPPYDYTREKEVRKRERDQERMDQSAHIARVLGSSLELSDAGKMIDQCKALHANAFAKAVRRKGTKYLQQISIGLLQDLHLYEPFLRPTESSVLVLSGSNFDRYDTGDYLCWLSPVSTEIAEKYPLNQRSEGKCRLLFHSACSDQTSRFSGKKELIDVCLSRFIIQLLLSDDNFFSKHRQSIEDDIKDSSRHRSETMQLLLEGCHRTDEVCIIIDRLDHIAPISDDCDLDEDYVSDLLEHLKIVSTASCTIRLIVTIDASRWPQVRRDSDFETKWKIWKRRNTLEKFSPLFKIDWQQPELQPW